MKRKKNVLGVILARGGSKGIKLKNIKNLCGHPLLSYSIYAGLKSKFISNLIVSTDNQKIAKAAKSYGAEVPFIRKKNLAGDKVPSKIPLRDAVLKAEKIFNKKFDYIIELPAVAPLRTCKDIDKALKILFKDKFDSVISFSRVFDKHPLRMKRIGSDGLIKDYDSKNPEQEISRRQDFPSCYIRNGAIYSMKRKTIIDDHSRMGKKIKPLLMEELKSINIDEISDFYTAEKIIEKGFCQNYPSIIYNDIRSKKINIIKKKSSKYFLSSYPKNIYNLSNHTLYLKNLNEIECDLGNYQIINKNVRNNVIAILVPTDGLNKLNKKILNNFSNLRYLITPSTGLTHLDTNYLLKRKIKLINLNNINDTRDIKASSEFCLLMILAALRKYKAALEVVKSGNWRNFEHKLRSNEIENLKFGFLGFGRIGQNVSSILYSLRGKIFYFDPNVNLINKKYKKINNLKTFLKNLDFLIISARLNKQTKLIINSSSIKYFKKGVNLINISRGELVEEKSLIKNIRNKKIGSYYTDVVSDEEKILKNKNSIIKLAKNFKNVSVSPHIGGLTFESETKAINRILYKFQKDYNKVRQKK